MHMHHVHCVDRTCPVYEANQKCEQVFAYQHDLLLRFAVVARMANVSSSSRLLLALRAFKLLRLLSKLEEYSDHVCFIPKYKFYDTYENTWALHLRFCDAPIFQLPLSLKTCGNLRWH